MSGKVTYRQQYTRCGKQRCRKCKEGAGHGPYWYAYWSENGRTISKYIGVRPPEEINGTAWEANQAQPVIALNNEVTSNRAEISSVSARSANGDFLPAHLPPARKAQNRGTGEPVAGQPGLRIYLLGQFRVERRVGHEWQSVANRTWHRRRARALLGCLLSNPGRRMGREQAMEALWPDLDIETAANRLNGAVHELRQILEPEIARPAASRMLRLERDVLTLADSSHIWVDAEAFEGLLNKANATTNPEAVEPILDEATALYSGDYLLEELYSEWAASRRESLRRGWMGLLLRLAELRAARGALISAIEPLDKLLTTDPTHETAVRRLMVLLTQLDRRGEAIRAYQRLAAILKRDYESEPLPETVELYNTLRHGRIPAAVSGTATVASPPPARSASPVSSPGEKMQTAHRETTTEDAPRPAQAFPRPTLQLARQNQSPLVGRDREMELMLSTVLSVEALSGWPNMNGHAPSAERKQKQAHFVLLTGEAGIGKTRLAEELSHEANMRGWAVAWTRAYEQEGTIPYRPWTDVLRALTRGVPVELLLATMEASTLGIAGAAVSESSPSASTAQAKLARLSTLLPELAAHEALMSPGHRTSSLSPEQERLHLWEAMLTLLSALSHASPLLLVLDDLHWTDDSSLELLAYLARHLQDEHVLLVGTCRDMELALASNLRTLLNDLRREQVIITLPVQPLTYSQIGSLVAHLPHHIVSRIQSQAGGNPLFAEELARVSEPSSQSSVESNSAGASPLRPAAEASNGAISLQSSLGAALPETITAVLERRLGKLSNECQALLGRAAVLGGSFEFQLLLHMTGEPGRGEDAILDLLEEALRSGLITEEASGVRILYHFWHPLIVSHLYDGLSAARRAQLHRRAANTLIQLHTGNEAEVAAAIAHHLSKSGSELRRLAHYAEIAGDRAFLLSAFPEAQRYYQLALSAIREGDLATAVNEQDPMHLAFLLERLAECEMVLGNYKEAIRFYEQELELRKIQAPDATQFERVKAYHVWKQQEAQLQALIWRAIGYSWGAMAEFEQARECYGHGQQVMREAGVTSGIAWACLHLKHGNLCWLDGNFDEARRYGQEALEMLEQIGRDAQEQNQKVGPSAAEPDSSYVQTHIRRALDGDPQELGMVHELLGVIAASIGQYTDALRHMNTALAIFEQRDNVTRMAQTCGNIGAVYAAKAENVVARRYFQRALELAERIGDVPSKAFVAGNLGDVAARCGDLLEAEEWFTQSLILAERISDREHVSWGLVALAAALQDQGNMRGALESIRRALAIGRAIKNTRRVGFALVALADWRLTQAVTLYQSQSSSVEELMAGISEDSLLEYCPAKHHLLRARAAVERALSLEGIDAETMTDGQVVQASINLLLGDLGAAQQQVMKIIEETCEGEMTRVQARSQRLLGRILAIRENHAEADTCFEQALRIFSQYEMRVDYARTLLDYGIRLVQRSRQHIKVGTAGAGKSAQIALLDQDETYRRGLAYLRDARDIFTMCKATIDQMWVERILAYLERENARA